MKDQVTPKDIPEQLTINLRHEDRARIAALLNYAGVDMECAGDIPESLLQQGLALIYDKLLNPKL